MPETTQLRQRPLHATDAQERRYHIALARMCEERGYLNLAESHIVQARDCPKDCDCRGCENTRAEADEARARRARPRLAVVRGGAA